MLTHRLREGTHTASTRSPATSVYAEITLGVIILLVGSLILSRSTSRGSRVSVRMRRRLMSSANSRMVNPWRTARCRLGRTGERFWGWHQRLDRYQGTVLLHGCSQSGEFAPQSFLHATGAITVPPVASELLLGTLPLQAATTMPVSCVSSRVAG